MTAIKSSDLEPSDELYEHQRIVCDPKQTPVRIDKFLIDRLEKVSRNRIQNAILRDESDVFSVFIET